MKKIQPIVATKDHRGQLIEVVNGLEWKQLNHMTIKSGEVRGNHYHKNLLELFYVIQGSAKLEIHNVATGKKTEETMALGDAFLIEPYDLHTVTALEDVAIISLYSEPFDPDDIHTNTDLSPEELAAASAK